MSSYRWTPRGPIHALFGIIVLIWGLVVLTQKFGWPVLAVFGAFFLLNVIIWWFDRR
jgi:hypothetical protein